MTRPRPRVRRFAEPEHHAAQRVGVKEERVVAHRRVVEPLGQRVTLQAHRPPRGEGIKRSDPHPEKQAILAAAPQIADYVSALEKRSRKVIALALRQLLRMVREYPRGPLLAAVREAAHYGLYDLDRLERMILRRVAREYFVLESSDETTDENE